MRRVCVSVLSLLLMVGMVAGCGGGKAGKYVPEPEKTPEEQKKYDEMMLKGDKGK